MQNCLLYHSIIYQKIFYFHKYLLFRISEIVKKLSQNFSYKVKSSNVIGTKPESWNIFKKNLKPNTGLSFINLLSDYYIILKITQFV